MEKVMQLAEISKLIVLIKEKVYLVLFLLEIASGPNA